MASHKTKLDLSLLQPLPAPSAWTRINPDALQAVSVLTEVVERVSAVEHFCFCNEKDDRDPKMLRRVEAHLRAALSEFVSMEEVAVRDFLRLGLGNPPALLSLSDPRVHALRLLRHANVHLLCTRLEPYSKPAVWLGPQGPQEFIYWGFLAANLDTSIRMTRGSRAYGHSDLTAMIEWMSAEQSEWGIHNVVLGATEIYARELAKRLS